MIRVNDPHLNQTWVYNYDRGGNILSKVRYAYTTGTLGTALETIPYTYGDANWKDKLTAYNGKSITYDAIGNPLTDGTWTYQWQAGRQLKQMTKSGTTIQFKYDHNGLRVGKVVNGTETKYMLHGKLVTHLTVGSDNLHFFYDAQSRPAKVSYNGVIYTYIHNLQGDIVGLLDNSGALVVEYRYDAWGKPIATTGSLAATLGKRNPFRYRGYIYDEETGLYYLRSRYYNPVVGRFVNADGVQTSYSAMLQCNLYCYCLNNPTIYADSEGRFALLAIGFGTALYMLAEAFVTAAVYTAAAVLTIEVATEVVDLVTDISHTRAREREITEAQTTTVTKTETATNTNQKKKNASPHLHHVVAKADWRAAPARKVLAEYGIDVWNSPYNLVFVPADKHVHLHTNAYYLYVNSRIIIASRRGGRAGVVETLRLLKLEILAGTIVK